MNECLNEWNNEWMNEWMKIRNEWMNEKKKWMNWLKAREYQGTCLVLLLIKAMYCCILGYTAALFKLNRSNKILLTSKIK